MNSDREKQKENLLSRWSRLKRESAIAPPATAKSSTATELPPLPPLETLNTESDFSAFLHPKVEEKLRKAALRKLFSQPGFNVMDGLDVYIDDYGKLDPIPPEMLKQLNQYIQMFEQPKDTEESAASAAIAAVPDLPALPTAEEKAASDIAAPELKTDQPTPHDPRK